MLCCLPTSTGALIANESMKKLTHRVRLTDGRTVIFRKQCWASEVPGVSRALTASNINQAVAIEIPTVDFILQLTKIRAGQFKWLLCRRGRSASSCPSWAQCRHSV